MVALCACGGVRNVRTLGVLGCDVGGVRTCMFVFFFSLCVCVLCLFLSVSLSARLSSADPV